MFAETSTAMTCTCNTANGYVLTGNYCCPANSTPNSTGKCICNGPTSTVPGFVGV